MHVFGLVPNSGATNKVLPSTSLELNFQVSTYVGRLNGLQLLRTSGEGKGGNLHGQCGRVGIFRE